MRTVRYGGLLEEGVCLGGCLLGGGSAYEGCKNITFLQLLLRMVKITNV